MLPAGRAVHSRYASTSISDAVLQQEVGLVPLEQGIIVEYMPVRVILSDFLVILGIVALVGVIASWFPVSYLLKRYAHAGSALAN